MSSHRDPCAPLVGGGCSVFEQIRQWVGAEELEEDQLRDISIEYEEPEIAAMTRKFASSRQLGSGNFGTVYRGTLPDGHEVAVKVLAVEGGEAADCGFAEEVRVLSRFRHPNLVTLMGWGRGRGWRYLVYELLIGGDVLRRLQGCSAGGGGRPFHWTERLGTALDASCGLAHMHNNTPKAFHRDIKSANILLDRSGTAKMADFGLSGIAKQGRQLNFTSERIGGTPGYACPRYVKSGRVTEETEVYAFGIVLLELLLNLLPASLAQDGAIDYPIFQAVMPRAPGAAERAVSGLDRRAEWPPGLARKLVQLALSCSSMEEARPYFTDVCRRLRQLSGQFCGQSHPGQQQQQQQHGWHAQPSLPLKHQLGSSQMAAAAEAAASRGGLVGGGPGSWVSPRQQHGERDASSHLLPPGRGGASRGTQPQLTQPQLGSFPPPPGGGGADDFLLLNVTTAAGLLPPSRPTLLDSCHALGGAGRGCEAASPYLKSAGSLARGGPASVASVGFGPAPLAPPFAQHEPCHARDAGGGPSPLPPDSGPMMSPQCQQLKQQLKQLQQKLKLKSPMPVGTGHLQHHGEPCRGSEVQRFDTPHDAHLLRAQRSLRKSMQHSVQQLCRLARPASVPPATAWAMGGQRPLAH